jgi:hypothetical protein
MSNKFKFLSIRWKQAFGALCLLQYCEKQNIQHKSVSQLIEHLLGLLVTKDLSQWEKKGAELELNGRGDALPSDLETTLDQGSKNEFKHLVDCVTEIGIVDMYGEQTDEPLKFLLKSMKILESNGITPPNLDRLFRSERVEKDDDAWGKPVSKEEYERILSEFGVKNA